MWPRGPAQCWGGFSGFPASSGFPNPPSPWQGFGFFSCGCIGSLFEALGNVLCLRCAAARRCPPAVPTSLGSSKSSCLLLSMAPPYPEVTSPGGKNEPVLPFQPGSTSEQSFITRTILCFCKPKGQTLPEHHPAWEKQRPATVPEPPAASSPTSSAHSLICDPIQSAPVSPQSPCRQQVPGMGSVVAELSLSVLTSPNRQSNPCPGRAPCILIVLRYPAICSHSQEKSSPFGLLY